MRIRTPFAGAFLGLSLISAYLGFTSLHVAFINDKVLHFVTFFILTTCFYWVLDTSRRRNLNLTLIVCTLVLGFGSEVVQGFLPNGRDFDPYDIAANVVGSLAAIGLSSWYHKRMLERKRLARQRYNLVAGDDPEAGTEGTASAGDVELGEAGYSGGQSTGPSLEEEVDNWNENAEDDWDEDEADTHAGTTPATSAASDTQNVAGEVDSEDKSKKRAE